MKWICSFGILFRKLHFSILINFESDSVSCIVINFKNESYISSRNFERNISFVRWLYLRVHYLLHFISILIIIIENKSKFMHKWRFIDHICTFLFWYISHLHKPPELKNKCLIFHVEFINIRKCFGPENPIFENTFLKNLLRGYVHWPLVFTSKYVILLLFLKETSKMFIGYSTGSHKSPQPNSLKFYCTTKCNKILHHMPLVLF